MSDIDYALRRQVADVSRKLNVLGEHVANVSGQVDLARELQTAARRELLQLRDDFQAYARQSELHAQVQRAETRIGVLQDAIDHDFGHYKLVRRTAVAMLQAFDAGLVTESTVRTVSEELMIQNPRYWLAPAVVALASWAGDDPLLCERSVEEAFRRSPDRTSLFFALVLRRQGRTDGAARWLRHYLLAQDPRSLGREFAVILEAVTGGIFGAAARDVLARTLTRWKEAMADGVMYGKAQKAQTRRWRVEIDSLRTPVAPSEFPRLALLSPQWGVLAEGLSSARTQQCLLDKYEHLLNQRADVAQSMEDVVDDLLDQLVSEYDIEELPLRRELAVQRAVVAHGGDVPAATAAAHADLAAHADTLDLLMLQTVAALNPTAIGVSQETSRLAVGACREWLSRAHAEFTRDYRTNVPHDVRIDLPTHHSPGAQYFRLPPWTGSFLWPLAELEKSLAAHWSHYGTAHVKSLAYAWTRNVVSALIVVLAVILLGTSVVSVLAALPFGLALALGWGVRVYLGARAAVRAQAQAREAIRRATAESLLQLREAAAELTDWSAKFADADAVATALIELITSLRTTTDNGSRFDGRVVLGDGVPA
ncbi:hypothetical protein H8N01_18985 [Streptomyces sp. AC536]|uniref:hypothetical protein n=1 Tax=Streptomyces buecherae TaxID=2763006 RepID=UPI00164ECB1C|nr:hypothetical protein [Streptomyces buecherae]MBC3984598.1 hypothetical protein [Streptomyces buecherae]QNJ39515.1 hypothetical protein H7H31_06150 [Streptomyces buecherae]